MLHALGKEMNRTITGAKMQRTALLIVMIFLISDLSSFEVNASQKEMTKAEDKNTHKSPILIDGLAP